MGDTVRGGTVRSVIWWIYYGLFLGICIFIFMAVIRYGIHVFFTDQRKLNGAQILYGLALGIMIFGLLSMSIAYLGGSIWHRIKGQTGPQKAGYRPTLGERERSNLVLQRKKVERLEGENHS